MTFADVLGGSSKDMTMNMVRILAKYKTGLTISHINAQSLNSKLDEFKLVFENSGVDIICVSETWLSNFTPDDIITPDGYQVFRNDRESHGGGVALFVRNGLSCIVREKSSSRISDHGARIVEFIFIEVFSFGRKILVGCVYRPNNRIPFCNVYDVLETLTMEYEDIVVCGDFNSNILSEVSLSNDMLSLGLVPINTTTPTHHSSTTSTLIDIIFVSDALKTLLYDQVSAPCFSRHDLLFLTYDFKPQLSEQFYSYRDFKNIDGVQLYESFLRTAWSDIYYMPSVEMQSSFLEENIQSLFDTTVPIKSRRISYKRKPWFNNSIKCAIDLRDLAYSRWKRFRTAELKFQYRVARANVNRSIKRAKIEYYSRRFDTAFETRQTWKTIREIGVCNKHRDTSCQMDPNELNRSFVNTPTVHADANFYSFPRDLSNFDDNLLEPNKFKFVCVTQYDVMSTVLMVKSNSIGYDNMHPKFIRLILPLILPFITHLFNTIIMSGTYPMKWRHAKIIPMRKSNGGYRPVAILCFLSKVLEKILYSQMVRYIDSNNLFSKVQSGFRTNHSCITSLVDVSENVRQALEDGDVNFLVLLDHSKAFDTVDHNMLIQKLRFFFRFSDTSAKLIYSYLSHRAQSVFLNGKWSDSLSLDKGVPQGSVLGPLFFSLYVNDLPEYILNCKIHLYADDVQLCLNSPVDNISLAIDCLNEELARVFLWATANGLRLNPTKSKCIVLHRRSVIPRFSGNVVINNERIEIVHATKNLGIIFNTSLTWDDHVNSLVGQTYVKLRSLWSTKCLIPLRIRILIAKTCLIPCLLYGCELFGNCDSSSKRKLNVLFNNIARYVYNLGRYDHISVAAKSLYGVTFDNLLNIRALLFLHRIINKREPNYLFERLRFVRSPRSKNIIIPRHQYLFSEWQFFIHAARLWNILPQYQQLNTNANSFKKFLFQFFQ